MMEEKRISVRVPSDDLVLLSELVYLKEYLSEADAVKSAIRFFLDSKFSPEEQKQIAGRLRSRVVPDLDCFISEDTVSSEVLGKVISDSIVKKGD